METRRRMARAMVSTLQRGLLVAAFSAGILTPVALAQSADLGVTKTGPDTAAPGSNVAYTINVLNNGPDDAISAVLTDNIPAGMLFVSSAQDSGPTFSCSDPPVGSGGTVSCSIAAFLNGSAASFTLVFQIPNGTPAGTLFLNTASISSSTPDPNGENDSSDWGTSTPPPPQADISVTKTGPTAGGAGTNVSFTILVSNPSSNDATTVSLQDTLPGTMTFVSFTPSAGCSTPMPGSGGMVTCNIGTFTAGSSITYTLVGQIPPGTASGTTFPNTANISSSNDPNAENNSSTATVTVSSVDLSVTKVGPATVVSGTPLTYTITVANSGPDTASNVVLSDSVPGGTTFTSLLQNTGPAASCSMPPPGGNGNITCSFVQLASGTSAQFTLTLGVGNVSSVSNTASVTSDSFDTNAANNSSTATTVVTQDADISITKIGPATVTAGLTLTYTITVTNNGPSSAQSLTLNDVLPANTTFVSFSAPAGWTPATPAAGGTGTVSATNPLLAVGAPAAFTLVVRANSGTAAASSITNTTTISSTTPDSNPGNNASSATASVATSADLALTKSDAPDPVLAGNNITYTINLKNNGPSDATAVSLTDAIPANTTFVSFAAPAGWLSTTPAVGATGPVTATNTTLIATSSATFTLVVQVTAGTPVGTTITNTATAASGTPDSNPANNTATATTAVAAPVSDLSITKTASPGSPYLVNTDVSFTIVVANAGPNAAASVSMVDTLPATMTFVSATPGQGTCSGTSTVTCSLGTIASGASATVTLVAHASANGPATNTATVSSASSDPNPANNTAIVAGTVVAQIPTLSPLLLALLAALLAAIALRLLTE